VQTKSAEPPQAAIENIRVVANLEKELQRERTTGERVADRIADFVGNIWFAIIHVSLIILWVLVNSRVVPLVTPFDPFPFILLALIVSCESVILSTFVLMKQNRMSLAADRRAHLNLQIDLLAEKEITKLLQLQELMCRHMGIPISDVEVHELSQETAVELLADEVKETLRERQSG
jgi:uncharacterized membrane protein